MLVLNIAKSTRKWGRAGRPVNAHPLLEDFTEGNGKSAGLPYYERTRGSGAGATWNCATDDNIANFRRNCADRWRGGSHGPATADPVVHFNGLTGEVSWDVTDDVLAGVNAWLIKKASERRRGRVEYYSKEGAAEAGNPDLAPRLILER